MLLNSYSFLTFMVNEQLSLIPSYFFSTRSKLILARVLP